MNIKITINRAAFIEFMGCLLARWERDTEEPLFINAAWYKGIELGTMVTQVLPDEPGKSYGKSIWDDILIRRKIILRKYKGKKISSIMVSYRTCSNIARCLGVDSQRHWGRLANENSAELQLPIPKSPNKLYQKDGGGWTTWFAFLDKEEPLEFLSYAEAKIVVEKQAIENVEEFREYVKSGLANSRMPKRPDHVYANEWQGWSQFLPPRFLSYQDAALTISSLGIKNETEFHQLGTHGNRPARIPSHPSIYYREHWKGWKEFLSAGFAGQDTIKETA
jgi:hypothetical protein